jgi:hypothetical protein
MSDSVSFKAQGRYQQIGAWAAAGPSPWAATWGLKISF